MQILIDECLPKQLKIWLGKNHNIYTVQEMNWANIKNGKLLYLANETGFDVFITADKNMYYQQNFTELKIACIVIPTNRKILVQKSVSAMLQSLERISPMERIVMDLGKDIESWDMLQLHSIELKDNCLIHIFKLK